ncbi:MAG: calcium-binding protein, partial [Pseudodonghicola sp.]
DLTPGGHSLFSYEQLAQLGPEASARGNIFNALLYKGDTRSLIENARGGSADDTIGGNQASNRLEGNAGNDALLGFGGRDILLGGSGHDLLRGGAGGDRLIGDSGADRMFGDAGNDRLTGGQGNDQIRGGAGNDVIVGGGGRDILFGDGGADVFRFLTAADSAPGARADHIRDFTGGRDTIDLSALVPGRFALRIDGDFTAEGPSVITQKSGADIRVRADLDGDGRADFELVLDSLGQIAAGDFLL